MITDSKAAPRLLGRLALPLLLTVLITAFAPARGLAQGGCFPTSTHLCLAGGRFQAEAAWTVPGLGSGAGQAVPLTGDTGSFWFFSSSNVELVVKVLDGRAVNRHFWVFYGGLSDVEYTLTVTDTTTGARETYTNSAHHLASAADVAAFAAEAPSPGLPPLAAPPSSPSPLLRLGAELPVNVTTKGQQYDPALALGPDGVAMLTWTGESAANGSNVYGRFFDPAGAARGGEVLLATGLSGPQTNARVAASPAGGFMTVWSEGSRVVARTYGADGQPLGGEIGVGLSPQIQGQAAIVGDPAGGFLVAWPDYGEGTGGAGSMHLQRFDARGNRVGNESSLLRRGRSLGLAAAPAAPAGTGGFLLCWLESAGTPETDVRALRLDAEARPLSSQALTANVDSVRHAGEQVGPVPVFHADGGFSIVWTTFDYSLDQPDAPGLYARRYTPAGEPAAGVVTLREGRSVGFSPPTAVALPSGATLVLWYEEGRIEDLDGGTFGRLYDASWQPLGGDLRINTFTQVQQTTPALAADAAGGVLAAWASGRDPFVVTQPVDVEGEGEDGSYFGVFAQRFTTATCALGSGQLCLAGRFRVAVQLTDPRSGLAAAGQAAPLTSDTGTFWFFDPANVELIVKVLDGRAVNGHFWVFSGALSDVDYTLTVTDTTTGRSRIYHNAPHQLASRADTAAF